MSNLASIARNDDLHKVRLFEQYSHLIHQWGRPDVSIPSFESWQHAQHIMFPGPRALHASLDDKEIFAVIETLIIYLGKAKLALHFDHPPVGDEQDAAKILTAVFSLDEQYVTKLKALLGFYVQRPDRS